MAKPKGKGKGDMWKLLPMSHVTTGGDVTTASRLPRLPIPHFTTVRPSRSLATLSSTCGSLLNLRLLSYYPTTVRCVRESSVESFGAVKQPSGHQAVQLLLYTARFLGERGAYSFGTVKQLPDSTDAPSKRQVSMVALNEYQYTPLKRDPFEIRLVKLLPYDGRIRITMHTFPLADAPPFDALSYAWEYHKYKVQVECEGAAIDVSPKVGAFLEALQRSSNTGYLWVEDMSLDKANPYERRHFMLKIASIYRAAARTSIWTRCEDQGPLTRFIASTLPVGDSSRLPSEMFSATDIFHSARKIRSRDLREFHDFAEDMSGDIQWDACDAQWRISAYLDQPYFKGPWALEHIVCSRNPLIFDGEEGIPWGHFAKALLTWLLFNTTSSSTTSVLLVICSEAMRRSHVGLSDTQLTLPDLIFGMRIFPTPWRNTQDIISKAYGILKHTEPASNYPIIDYSMAEDRVACEAASQLNDVSYQPLSLSLLNSANPYLPSWTPNWKQHTTRFLLNHAVSNFSASPYAMCEVIYEHRSTYIEYDDFSRAGVAYVGLVVGVIQHRSSYLPPRRHCDHYAVSGANNYFFSEWHDFAKEHSRGKRPAHLVSLAFADTIQARGCGHVWEDMEKTPEDRIQETTDFLDFLESEDSVPVETDSIRLFYAACFPSHERMFAITKGGRFCLVPKATKDGDLVCIPHGSRVPYVFRQDREGGLYQNMGEAFVHGLMHGEAGELEPQDIRTFHLR